MRQINSKIPRRIVCLIILSFLALFSLSAEPKVALLIGNGAYQYNNRLSNPVNDATDMSRTLKDLGFRVTTLLDAGLSAMSDAVYAFRGALLKDSATVGVFYYSGHGVQSEGVNYLLPVDQDIRTEVELARKAIPAQEVLSYMNEARNAFNMVVLDACRNNPLEGTFRSASRGLAVVASAPPQTLIVYSTGAGDVAEDGTGRNSPFAETLMKYIKEPGLDAEAMLRRVTGEVQAETNYRQTPYKYSSLTKDFYFAGMSKTAATGTMTMERRYGSISVEVKESAKIYVDDVYKGEIPAGGKASINGVATGSRRVEARYSDGRSESRSVTVADGSMADASFSYVEPAAQPEETAAAATAKSLSIGDTYAGGIIFYLDGKGGGLVAAPSDQSKRATWAEAKRICDDLVLNGYSDWYLPSKDELNLMYQNLKKKGFGGVSVYSYYWSSSEYNASNAWVQGFYIGDQGYSRKYYYYRVRAARAF